MHEGSGSFRIIRLCSFLHFVGGLSPARGGAGARQEHGSTTATTVTRRSRWNTLACHHEGVHAVRRARDLLHAADGQVSNEILEAGPSVPFAALRGPRDDNRESTPS